MAVERTKRKSLMTEQERAVVEAAKRRRSVPCFACGGEEFGCCVCEHTGRVWEDAIDALDAEGKSDG